MVELLSQCYLGLNQDEKALDVLLPNILENGLASNKEIVEISFKTLLKTHSKEELKALFQNAFKKVVSEKEVQKKSTYTHHYITFLNRKIKIQSWHYYEGLSDLEKEKVINEILEESSFYSLLKN